MARSEDVDPLRQAMEGLIGEGTTLTGEFLFNGGYRIDGKLTGRLSCSSTLIVGPPGELEADELQAGSLVVSGSVKASELRIQNRLEITRSGRVQGNVTLANPGFVLAPGGIFDGTIVLKPTASDG